MKMNQFSMDINNDHSTHISPQPHHYIYTNKKLDFDYNITEVLDLSKRRDSVETPRKTPSPYTASSFGSESSPSTLHDSPSTTAVQYSNRAQTPVHHYAYGNRYGESDTALYTTLKHRIHIKQQPLSPTDDVSPYLAVQLQQKIAAEQSLIRDPDDSIDYSRVITSPTTTTATPPIYPMILGRDGKLARPFKAYPRDPLSITASFTATDSIIDDSAVSKYSTFRKRMLEQIHAANGGQATISNPKMRRTNTKSSDCNGDASHHIHPSVQQLPSSKSVDDRLNDTNNNDESAGPGQGNSSDSSNPCIKDSAYFERRKKNNAAAKKSRDRRRIKEDEIAIRAAFLERENIELRFELASAKKQLSLYGVTTST